MAEWKGWDYFWTHWNGEPIPFVGGTAGSVIDTQGALGSTGANAGEILNPSQDPSLVQSDYDFTSRIFPLDLVENDPNYSGHYMIINISVQSASAFGQVSRNNGAWTTLFTRLGDLSKVDALRFTIDGTFRNEAGNLISPLGTRPRFTKRIRESIALYMPNSELTFTDAQEYSDISMTDFATSSIKALGGIAGAFIGGILGPGAGIGGAIGANVIGNILDKGGNAIGTASRILGNPINPKTEVLFAKTNMRQFTFEFLFSPDSPEESRALHQIIKTLRFHAAPELRPGIVNSFFYVPPSEFDITFYHRGQENQAIPRINTCVLERIDISYAPAGTWSTFENGFPTQIRMVLGFKEVEITHKLRVLQGF
jgi:hypothetical protein